MAFAKPVNRKQLGAISEGRANASGNAPGLINANAQHQKMYTATFKQDFLDKSQKDAKG